MNDESLAPQHDHQSPAVTPFGDPDGAPVVHRELSIEEVLSMAKRVEKVARVCLRADLQAEHDELLTELAGLVDASGKVIVDEEASVGDQSPAARAEEIQNQLAAVRRQMAGAMWSVRFEGMASDDWAVFQKQHLPKGEDPDLTEFNTLLIAACAIQPKLTVDQVRALRKKLGPPQVAELATKAWEANTRQGLNVPKSPASLAAMTRR